MVDFLSSILFFFAHRAHGNGLSTVSASSMLNSGNNHHVLTPVPGDPSGRLVMTLLPSQGGPGHDMMMHGGNGTGTMGLHGLHEQHHSGASSSSHSTRYNQGINLTQLKFETRDVRFKFQKCRRLFDNNQGGNEQWILRVHFYLLLLYGTSCQLSKKPFGTTTLERRKDIG